MLQKQNLIGIYAIVNVVSQDYYIGKTWAVGGIKGRLEGHLKQLRKNIHGNGFLQNSFNKYGEEAFIAFPLEIVDGNREDLNIRMYISAREKYWVDELKPIFNLQVVEDGNWTVTDSTREKMSESAKIAIENMTNEQLELRKQGAILGGKAAITKYNKSLKGKPVSENRKVQLERARQSYREQGVSRETRDKLSKASSEREITEEWRQNISKSRKGKPSPMKGKHFSDEARTNMSAAQKARNYHPSDEAREKMSIKNFSDEGRKKIGEASKKRWDKFRLEKQLKQQQSESSDS